MPFLPQRNLSFPAFCILRVTHCLNMLAYWSLFSGNFPWGSDHSEEPHNHREGQTNTQKFVQSRFLFRKDPVSLGLSGNFLENEGTHPECEPGYQILVAKFTFFSQWTLKKGGLATAWESILHLILVKRPRSDLRIHPVAVFLLLTALALLHPFLFL